MIRIAVSASLLAALFFAPACLQASEAPVKSILTTVRSSNTLTCGVVREEEDYSRAEMHGNRAAFDFDLCKAISTAVNGPAAKTALLPFADEPAALQALRAGKVQIVATATSSLVNTNFLGIVFSPAVIIDGQGFLVKKNSGIATPRDLAGKKVCYIDETETAQNLLAWAARENVKLFPFPFEEDGEMEAAMYTGNCAAMTSDVTKLANTRARYNVRANTFDILSQTITIDPLAVAYLPGDAQWSAVVNATVSALIQAEESGVTAANVEQRRDDTIDPAVPVYFARKNGTATILHLDADWAVHVIQSVGNYGEMYERDLGAKSPLRIERGQSNLWDKGGVIYAPPVGTK